jgi:hypothetical protein
MCGRHSSLVVAVDTIGLNQRSKACAHPERQWSRVRPIARGHGQGMCNFRRENCPPASVALKATIRGGAYVSARVR